MKESGDDRLRRGAELSEMMRTFCRAGLEAKGFSGRELEAELAVRMYGRRLSTEAKQRLYDGVLAKGGTCLQDRNLWPRANQPLTTPIRLEKTPTTSCGDVDIEQEASSHKRHRNAT